MDAGREEDTLVDDQVSEETETSTVEFNIIVTSSDLTLELLANKFDSSDIVIPDYQRKFIWDIRRASTLIESFAIGLPVPQVFFYENQDGQLEVIDGQQRITSIAYFFSGFFGPEDEKGNRKIFRLKGLEQRKDLEGMSFTDLDERTKRKLKNASLRVVTVRQLSPDSAQPESVYHIFERLNTGGQPLNAQEIRNVVYRGTILAKLEQLNSNEHWRNIYGKPDPDPKQRDIELILRLFALYENAKAYKPPMKDFLSREMANNRDFDSERAVRFSDTFTRAAELVDLNIHRPFRPKGLLNAATMEAVMVALMEQIDENGLDQTSYTELIQDEGFLRTITSNTTSLENVSSRKSIASKILFGDE